MNQKLTRMLGNAKLKLNEKAPKILFVSGIVLGITTVVLACKETLSAGDILDDHAQQIDDIKSNDEDETTNDSEDVVVYCRQEDKSKLILKTYANTFGRLAKLYYPSILCGTASIILLTKSHSMQNERYLASLSAYMALKQEYDKYRESVSNDIGQEKDNDYKVKAVSNKSNSTDDMANPPYGRNLSGYAKIFDEYNPNWNKDASLNNVFLRRSLNYLNNKLQAQGYLFLNDVYRELGFEPTKAGQIVGWTLNNPNGDGYIDFGLDRNINKQKAEFINGLERSVILDFNPDGPILDLLLWEK